MFDEAPFSSSKAFSATSQRTFHGQQAMIYVHGFCTTCCAITNGRAELLPAQLAIRVDYRYIELARCGHKANLDLMQENYVPTSPLFLHLAARGTRRGLKGTPSARPSRLVSGMTIPAARLPCWGRELGFSNLYDLG